MVRNVLLVDDDLEMLRLLQEGLAGHADAFAVLTAGDGAEALECLRHHNVSLVVTDLKMPRMDGFELLAAILEGYPDIPVIVMSGFSAPGLESTARRGGAVGFIAKPFSIDALAQKILTMLRREAEGGTLHNVSTGMFLQLIEMEQKTCTIRSVNRRSGQTGVLFFREGALLDARVGAVQGEPAASEIFTWEHVSLSIQNGCTVREQRIRKALNLLLLEAMHRKDEVEAAIASEPAAAFSSAENAVQRLRAGMAGVSCGLGDILRSPEWKGRLKRISHCGERLNLGRLTLGYVATGDACDYILVPADEGAVVAVNATCPRDKLMQLLAE